MSLFNIFKNDQQPASTLNGSGITNTAHVNGDAQGNGYGQPIVQPEIPRELFVEERNPQDIIASLSQTNSSKGIDSIYDFLQADYESRGYSDALTNADDSYKTDNIQLLKHDLSILIQKVTTYYDDIIREIDLHISTRGRAGLVDLVEELKTRKEMVMEHKKNVNEIKNDLVNNTGVMHRVILSYQRGFMRGLSALTLSQVLNKKL